VAYCLTQQNFLVCGSIFQWILGIDLNTCFLNQYPENEQSFIQKNSERIISNKCIPNGVNFEFLLFWFFLK